MRRALLLAALALPVGVRAVTPGVGTLLEPDNFNATSGKSYVNAAACSATKTLNLEWSIQTVGSKTFDQTGTFLIFASDTAPAVDSKTGGTFCAEKSTTTTPIVNAAQVDSFTASTSPQSGLVSGLKALQNVAFVAAAATSCDSSIEGKLLYICAHWTDSNGNTQQGFAIGTFQVQVLAPNAPTSVSAGSGDGRLLVSWTASAVTDGFAPADHYIAQATPVGGTTTVYSEISTGTSATISGLQNGTEYTVVVYAYSVGGNRSADGSEPVTGTPIPSADFWKTYKDRGGVESGGCSSGPPDLLALAGAVSLLALRRRKQ